MKQGKTRCQLFLPDEMDRRLRRIAAGTGKSRSEILLGALDAWLNARGARAEEAMAGRLGRMEGQIEGIRRRQALQWEILARIMRHQILTGAALPRPDAATEAAAARQFDAVIEEIAQRLTGKPPPPTTDPGLAKVRALD